eukprot:379859_1
MGTRFTIQSIPDDEKYDLLTTDKGDGEFVEQDELFANIANELEDGDRDEKKANYLFIEDCLVHAEMSKHSNSPFHFGMNHNIWQLILKVFPYIYFADYVIIGIKIAWCFTSLWYLVFIDVALTFIAFLLFYKIDNVNILSASNTFEHLTNIFMILFDSSQVFYAYILALSTAFNNVIKKLLRKRYFQNTCSIFINQNEFIRAQNDTQIMPFLKNVNYHVMNIISLYLFRVYLRNIREDGDTDQEAVDNCEAFVRVSLKKYQNCLLSSHKQTHHIFDGCHCEEHTFDTAKDLYLRSLHNCYFNLCYLRYFGAVLIFYVSFYSVGFVMQNTIQNEFSASWSLTLSVLLYLRLGVNCLLLVAFVVLIYVQYYHFQLQSLKKMDMYWLDPTLVVLNDKMRSDASLHFTLNGYCDYIRAVMGNYYVCCLLYGLKIHNSESLISLISFSSIDTIAEYLNHEDPFTEFTNRAHDDKDTIATNIQTTQKMIVQQLKRIRNTFTPTPKNNDVIVHMPLSEGVSTQYVAVNTSPKEDEGIDDDDTVYLIKPPPTKEAEEAKEEEEDDDTNCIPSTLDFQRAAFNIKRFNPDVADKEAIFSALRAIGFDPYETTRGIIDLQNEQINQKLTRFEGVIDYLSLMGFQSDESDRFLVLVSANAEILHHAVYGLNGFLAPLMWSKPPKPQEEDE